jgi:hypothetical protein
MREIVLSGSTFAINGFSAGTGGIQPAHGRTDIASMVEKLLQNSIAAKLSCGEQLLSIEIVGAGNSEDSLCRIPASQATFMQ